jgi:hypothetical protein
MTRARPVARRPLGNFPQAFTRVGQLGAEPVARGGARVAPLRNLRPGLCRGGWASAAAKTHALVVIGYPSYRWPIQRPRNTGLSLVPCAHHQAALSPKFGPSPPVASASRACPLSQDWEIYLPRRPHETVLYAVRRTMAERDRNHTRPLCCRPSRENLRPGEGWRAMVQRCRRTMSALEPRLRFIDAAHVADCADASPSIGLKTETSLKVAPKSTTTGDGTTEVSEPS